MRAAIFKGPGSVADGYRAMDERRAIKSLVRVGAV